MERRNNRRVERRLARAALVKAKANKRRWTVYLLLTLLVIGAVIWVAFK